MRIFALILLMMLLSGCNRAREIAPPDGPLAFTYRICDSECQRCGAESQRATLNTGSSGTGTLALTDLEAVGRSDIFFLKQCQFYSNGDWHCLVDPNMNLTASVPHLLTNAWFKREIGFKNGNFYARNADDIPTIAQRLNPEMIQFQACLAPQQPG